MIIIFGVILPVVMNLPRVVSQQGVIYGEMIIYETDSKLSKSKNILVQNYSCRKYRRRDHFLFSRSRILQAQLIVCVLGLVLSENQI